MTIQIPIAAPILQRAKGAAAVSLVLKAGRVRLAGLRQQGSAKAILPHVTDVPEVVFLNTSGGLTGGDRLSYRLDLGDGCRAVATTQTAERAYRATEGRAQVDVSLTVGAGGWVDWLPQETILFDHSALGRDTRIDLGAGAGCLALEAVVLGRAAMGEVVRTLSFHDRREIRSQGRLRLLEPLMLESDALLAGASVLGDARAFASLVLLGQGAEDALAPLRHVLNEAGVTAAASAFDGKLVCRIMAADGWPMRRQIARALSVLRRNQPLPRVWQI